MFGLSPPTNTRTVLARPLLRIEVDDSTESMEVEALLDEVLPAGVEVTNCDVSSSTNGAAP